MLFDELLHGTVSSRSTGILHRNAFNTIYIMSSQLHNRGSATARNPRGIGHNPIFKDRFLNGTVVRLLAAPTVDDNEETFLTEES